MKTNNVDINAVRKFLARKEKERRERIAADRRISYAKAKEEKRKYEQSLFAGRYFPPQPPRSRKNIVHIYSTHGRKVFRP